MSGRGEFPIKFNGNLFTTEKPPFDADYRQWGGMYWFQNTRWPYWSMLVSGDVDLMAPFFDMYVASLPLHERRTRKWFAHGGAFFPETQHFWGALGDGDYGCAREGKPVWYVENSYIRYHVNAGLELLALAVDVFAFTQNATFGRESLLPLADAVLTFFDSHYPRDINGLLLLTPSQALETYQSAINPSPDVAGLTFVLQELLLLPDHLFADDAASSSGSAIFAAAEYKDKWRQLLDIIPDLPVSQLSDGQCRKCGMSHSDPSASSDEGLVLAPATAWDPTARNVENPALYSVFPFRLFQVGKEPRVALPLDAAASAFNTRSFPCNKGWCSDAVQAAHLGAAEYAAELVTERFSSATLRFEGFYQMHFDHTPEVCTGAVAKTALQAMLLQYDGSNIFLFPAWPRDWSVSFKLSAPQNTVVEAACSKGFLTHLLVSPPHRRAQVSFPGSWCAPTQDSSL